MINASLIIGNLCSLLGMISDSLSSTRKTAAGVLSLQTLGQVFFGVGSAVLKGYSAAVQSAVSILRNLAAIKKIDSRPLELALTAAGVIFGFLFNNLGVVGLLPIIANLEYTLVIFRYKDNARILKMSFFVNVSLFTIFNAFICNFVGVVSNCVILASIAYSLIKTSH
ncbi:MAG: YgjV family protein [Oscillospiraceae bacterium]|nr:YgjV family protein [Oscillospiraceae bacterium]